MGEVIPGAVIKIQKAIIQQRGQKAGTMNASGEAQLALDVQANNIAVEELKKSKLVWWLASEELEDPEQIGDEHAPFTVVFDPLDGSSLVDVNFAVGSIFGIYAWPSQGECRAKHARPKEHTERWDMMKKPLKGDFQVAACYGVYGPKTTLVLTVRKGTHAFELNPEKNEFYLVQPDLHVDADAKYYAPGNARAANEIKGYKQWLDSALERGLTLRYSGGMVPDIHHILAKGSGIFAYPGFSKYPQGKLRLAFECAPMALLMEQAGGAASNGKNRILEQMINDVHQRSPIYLGSKNEVEKLEAMLH